MGNINISFWSGMPLKQLSEIYL